MIPFLAFCFTLLPLMADVLGRSNMNVQVHATPATIPNNQLLVLMLDGFKWDYLDLILDNLGGFSEFVKHGVRTEHVNGIFPTVSYPSWTTLSTGLYTENHGIMGNYFYNRGENVTFELEKRNDELFWWQNNEPIWTTASQHGLKVGTILWSRSEVPVNGVVLEASQGYQLSSDWTAIQRSLETCLDYLGKGYNLVMAYGEHIDNVGHRFGPKSSQLKQALIDVGKVLENFFIKLEEQGQKDKVNVLLVSDHGMTSASSNASATRYHQLQSYINASEVEYLMGQGALVQIYAKPGCIDLVYNRLEKIEGLRVYKKQNIPESYHFRNNVNAPDVLLVAEKGHLIIGAGILAQIPDAWITSEVEGVHGYDTAYVSDMRTVFMATGPDFQRGVVKPAIDLVDIYQVYCHLLNVQPQPHNGTWSKVMDFFTPKMQLKNSSAPAGKSTLFLDLFVVLPIFFIITNYFNLYL